MPKVLIIANPLAGNQKTKEIARKFSSYLKEHRFEFEVYTTQQPGDFEGIKQAIQKANPYFLSIIGGDGTLNEVLNCYEISQKPLWHIIPCGLSNNFARSFYGALLEPEHFFDRILQPLPLHTDVGRINDVYFLSSASIGIGAGVRRFADVFLPRWMPIWLRYRLALLYHLFHQNQLEGFISDETGVKERMHEISGMVYMNAGYTGYGYKMNTNNQLNDGLLECLSVKKMRLLVGFGVIKDLEEGQMQHNNNNTGLKRGSFFQVELNNPVLYHADGFFYTGQTFEIQLIPQKIQILI